jgi:hypothetical protein
MQTGFIICTYNHEDLDPHPFYKTFLIYYRFIIKGNDICKIEKVNVWQSGSMLTVDCCNSARSL